MMMAGGAAEQARLELYSWETKYITLQMANRCTDHSRAQLLYNQATVFNSLLQEFVVDDTLQIPFP